MVTMRDQAIENPQKKFEDIEASITTKIKDAFKKALEAILPYIKDKVPMGEGNHVDYKLEGEYII